jgi:hypothetical protein
MDFFDAVTAALPILDELIDASQAVLPAGIAAIANKSRPSTDPPLFGIPAPSVPLDFFGVLERPMQILKLSKQLQAVVGEAHADRERLFFSPDHRPGYAPHHPPDSLLNAMVKLLHESGFTSSKIADLIDAGKGRNSVRARLSRIRKELQGP